MMRMMQKYCATFFFRILFCGIFAVAAIWDARAQVVEPLKEDFEFFEEEEEDYPLETEPVVVSRPAPAKSLRKIDDETWAKAAKNLEYSERDKEKNKNKNTQKVPDLLNLNSWGEAIQTMAVALALILIALGVFFALRQPADRRLKNLKGEITPDNIEQYLEVADIDPFLAQALAAGQYDLAIRYRYLRCLQQLGIRQLVKLAVEKTNRQYLRELDGSGLKPEFARLTLTYENVWYGRQPIDSQRYQELAPMYDVFLKKIS